MVAAVTAVQLYGATHSAGEGLLRQDDVPPRVRRGMRRFTLDPSTVKVDWALSGPVPGPAAARRTGTVHVADDVPDMSSALGQVAAGSSPPSCSCWRGR